MCGEKLKLNIEKIEIKNFKGIEQLDINFSKRFNLIIGNNGFGKTSILDAIATVLGGFVSGIDGVYGRHINNNEVRIETKTLGDASYNVEYKVPVELTATADFRGHLYTWTRRKSSYKASRSTIEPRDIAYLSRELIKDSTSIMPVISYQGAGRMWTEGREHKTSKKNDLSRYGAYVGSLWPKSNTKKFIKWCAKMEQISWSEDRRIMEYEVVKDAVMTFMSEMNDSSVTKIFYSKKEEELVYEENGTRISINLLSSGYQALIWMAFDIAYRMAVLNPELRENITQETTGIILIDEIDVHLHPRWQWKIINALMKTFPKVQFIATTHSPIVLASSSETKVIRINENHQISYEKSSYGIPIEDVLTAYQQTEKVPKEVKKNIELFSSHLSNKHITEAELALRELELLLGSNNPIVVSAEMELEFEKIELD